MGGACTSASRTKKKGRGDKGDAPSLPPSAGRGEGGGSLSVVSGPMFSGKTTWMIEQVGGLLLAGQEEGIVCWIPAIDGRSAGRFRAHHKNTREVGTRTAVFDVIGGGGEGIAATPVAEPIRAARQTVASKRTTVVAIDEAHMFPAADFGEAVKLLLEAGIDVYVAGLDHDCMREPYEWVGILEEASGSGAMFKSMLAECFLCGRGGGWTGEEDGNARWTVRTEPIYTGSTEDMIGGSEKYQPACDVHWKAPPPPGQGDYVWKLKDTPLGDLISSPPAFSPPSSPPPPPPSSSAVIGGKKAAPLPAKKMIMASTAPHSCYPPMMLDEMGEA